MTQKDTIYQILKDRVLVIAGPMGTNIQRLKLSEEDYRGELYKNHKIDLKGDIDLLSITQPEIVKKIHRQFYRNPV